MIIIESRFETLTIVMWKVPHLFDNSNHSGHQHDAGGLWGIMHTPKGGGGGSQQSETKLSDKKQEKKWHLHASLSLLTGWSASSWEDPKHSTRWYWSAAACRHSLLQYITWGRRRFGSKRDKVNTCNDATTGQRVWFNKNDIYKHNQK